jgi:hypothetical protein
MQLPNIETLLAERKKLHGQLQKISAAIKDAKAKAKGPPAARGDRGMRPMPKPSNGAKIIALIRHEKKERCGTYTVRTSYGGHRRELFEADETDGSSDDKSFYHPNYPWRNVTAWRLKDL